MSHLPRPSPLPSHPPLSALSFNTFCPCRLGICHPNPPSVPLFFPPFLYRGIFLSPFPSALSSLSITLSVIDGGAGRQPGKSVLHICPFLRLLPLFRRLCLSARPRRCCSYLFPCTLSPLPSLLHQSLCCLSTFAVHDQSGSHDTMMWPSRFLCGISVVGKGGLNNDGVFAWKLDNVAVVSRC